MDINIKRFWNSGSGKQLIEWSGARPVRFLIDEPTCDGLGISKVRMYFLLPWFRKFRNFFWQKFTNMSAKNYQRAIYVGDVLQRKISEEYLKADGTPH